MSDTIDRLVRILDEERSNHIRVRRDFTNKQNNQEYEISRLRRDVEAAETKLEEWMAYADALLKSVPVSKRAALPERPGPIETEIPF